MTGVIPPTNLRHPHRIGMETDYSGQSRPLISKVKPGIELLRVHVRKGGLDRSSDILVDQVRAIDNQRLLKRLGKLSRPQAETLVDNLRILLDL